MAATGTPGAPSSVVEPPLPMFGEKPPIIEGFEPSPILQGESFRDKLRRKTMENPFVPIGCLGTAGALLWGLYSFKKGETRKSQLLMRGRIAAQGFTVFALVFGVIATGLRPRQ